VYPLLIATGLSLATTLCLILIPNDPLYFSGPFAGILVFAGAFFAAARLSGKRVQPFLEAAQRHAQAGKVDQAIESYEGARKLSRWQLFLDRQINTQIGILHYAMGEEDKAAEFLAKGYPKIPQGPLVLGALLYRGGKTEEAKQALTQGIQFNKDSAMLPNLLAWIHEKEGQPDEAVAVLNGTSKVVRANAETSDNLDRLKNGKKMNMKGFGQNWFMLKFEVPKGMAQGQVRKGFRQPPKNKGKAKQKAKKGKKKR
jgi:tetratricopeptide (TPR) repeat protein